MTNVTRGDGLLEGLLAKKRAVKANSLIADKLRKGRILDIGCGVYPYFLMNTEFSGKHGIDQVSKNSKGNSVELKNVNFEKTKLPFGNNFFNVVTMLAVFEHINADKLNFVLGEARRVLKINGILIITTPAPWSDKLLHSMAEWGLISSEEIHDHKHNFSDKNVVEFLSNVGFDKKKIKKGFFEMGLNMWFCAEK